METVKVQLLFTTLLLVFTAGIAVLTSNVTDHEVCPGKVISFTCTHNPPEELVQWTIIRSQLQIIAVVQFTAPYQTQSYRTLVSNEVTGNAVISSSTSSTVVSSLTITITAELDGNVVECTGSMLATKESILINITSIPSPPQNVMVTIVENGTATVTVNIDWNPPVNNDGGAVDSYTVETSPETATVRVTSGTITALELSYNERYVVSVTAENCVGNSTPVMTDPVEFVNCSTPSTNPNITFEPYQYTTEGSMVSYQCRPGFIPEGRVISVCGGDGRWNPDPDQHNCREVNCGAPSLPVNSSMLSVPSNDYRKGSIVIFQCNEGLFPSNEITIVCTSEQRWDPDPERIVVCGEEPVNCSRPNAPRGGFLDEVTSTTLMFGCNEGYSPQGTVTAVCVATDTWSPNPAQLECIANVTLASTESNTETTVTPLPELSNGSIIIIGTAASVGALGLIVIVILLAVAVCIMSKNKKTSSKTTEPENKPHLYDEILTIEPPEKAIELQENVAYGPIRRQV